MNFSMSTTCASYELVDVYNLRFLWTCQCPLTRCFLWTCPLVSADRDTKAVFRVLSPDFQRACLTLMWWFCSAACLPYRDFSPQHRTESCLQTCTCWKLERDAWAALVWWTLFRDSCLEVFLANTETEMLMMLRLRLRLRLKPSAQVVESATHFGCRLLLHD